MTNCHSHLCHIL